MHTSSVLTVRITYRTKSGDHARRKVRLAPIAGETDDALRRRAGEAFRRLYPRICVVSIDTTGAASY